MHDVESIEEFEGLEELSKDAEGLLLWERALLFQSWLEGAPIAVLVHEVIIIAGLEVVLVFDNVLVGTDRWKSFDFIQSALFQLSIFLELLYRDDLDCKLARTTGVDGSIDFCKGALSNFLNEGVVINHFNHLLQSQL